MDIDCDGANRLAGDCANDQTGQSQTAFQDEVQSYRVGISDLDANAHPYVVLGNSGASPSFDPSNAGIEPLSVVAVVCNNQLVSSTHGKDSFQSNIALSTTGSGETQMEELQLANLLSRWPNSASQMSISPVTVAMELPMCYTSHFQDQRRFLDRLVLLGPLMMLLRLKRPSKALEIGLLPNSDRTPGVRLNRRRPQSTHPDSICCSRRNVQL